jgi:hypothetical protein
MIPILFILLLAALIIKISYHYSYFIKESGKDLNYLEFLIVGIFKRPLQWFYINSPFFIVSAKGKYRTMTIISVVIFWIIVFVVIFYGLSL